MLNRLYTPGNCIRLSLILLCIFFPFMDACKEDETLPPLKITAIEPPVAHIGDTIYLTGQGFSPGYSYNHVTFSNGRQAEVLIGSTTERLMVKVPHGALSGVLTVDILEVETAQTSPIEIKIPVIDEIVPPQAWIGDTIVINGQNFQPNKLENYLAIGGRDARYQILFASRTQLKVVVPKNAASGAISLLGFEGPVFTINPSMIDAVVQERVEVGDTIEIKGKGMSVTKISFPPYSNSTSTAPIDRFNTSRSARVVVPAGAVDGRLKVENDIGNNLVIETPAPLEVYPSIKSVTPLSGYAGAPVTISGYNFSAVESDNSVQFNGTSAQVTEASFNELVVTVPDGFTTGHVTVVVNGRKVEGPVFSVAEPGAPVIYNLTPRSGPVGSTVMIDGVDFGVTIASNVVKFTGGVNGTVVTASATRLVVEVPAGAQSGAITVTKEGKTGVSPSFTITDQALPFITSVTPASAMRNATITVNGGNFKTAPNALVLGTPQGHSFTIVSVTASRVEAKVSTTPNISPGSYTLFVRQDEKKSNEVSFEVSAIPSITSLDITEGTPGSVVTITGNDFNKDEASNTVKFGTNVATLVNPDESNDNVVKVYVPDVEPGVYNVTLTAFGNTSSSKSFTVKSKKVAVRNIVYAENNQPKFSVKRLTSDPPSESTLFSRVFSNVSMFVVTLDMLQSKAYFTDEDGMSIARVNLDQSGYEVIYHSASPTSNAVSDITLDTDHQKLFFTDLFGDLYAGSLDGTQAPELLYGYNEDGIVPIGVSYMPDDNSLYFANYYPDFVEPSIVKGSVDGNQLTELFTAADGLVTPCDIKLDFGDQKIFVLDGLRSIRVGNLDGSGSLPILITRNRDILGMALDTQEKFVYWMEFINDAKTRMSVFRMKYDQSVIPGTDPPASIEEVYSNLVQWPGIYDPNSTGTLAGLAVEDSNGGSAMRGGKSSSSSGIKMRRPLIKFNPVKKK